MPTSMDAFLNILDIETIDPILYRGISPNTSWQRVFGGQVIGQALLAAQRTVEQERLVHSLHCYFMRPGDPNVPILYAVDRIRDGKSFTTRRVVASQRGDAIFSLEASFQAHEQGLEHQVDLPSGIPQPEELLSLRQMLERMDNVPEPIRRYFKRDRPLELRPVFPEHYTSTEKLPPVQHVWVKMQEPVEDPRIQSAALAYLSDMTLLDTATFPHGGGVFDPRLQMASLDHAMWFHRQDRLDDWILYTQDSPWAGSSRGFTRGALYTRAGLLIASTVQEGLMRLRTK
ncbi:acyl-CoA thioesterase [Limoniibacter endophyticus]|uniref:Acyl-CoA thioesterase 2 n=1 Tax=Limoniibacter endophyticus TaxID=1565040 RepID=A0A8J3DNH4_9HYPH|nr:acyl-CoA thioesterase II [Limoniibacter endophyticus]GHC74011.1 acyl-CoA thioesterase II [Limoniibacter endophyticus]